MLVITDQQALRVSGQSCLTSARQPEEQSCIAVLAYIGGAVHRENIALRQEEIHDAEDGFLHLAGILGAANQDKLAGKVHNDESVGAGAVTLRVSLEFRSGNNGEF